MNLIELATSITAFSATIVAIKVFYDHFREKREEKMRCVYRCLRSMANGEGDVTIPISKGSEALGRYKSLNCKEKIWAVKELKKIGCLRWIDPPKPFDYRKFVTGCYKKELEELQKEDRTERKFQLLRLV